MGVEWEVVTIKLEILSRVRDGRGGVMCELCWAAKRWQRLYGVGREGVGAKGPRTPPCASMGAVRRSRCKAQLRATA